MKSNKNNKKNVVLWCFCEKYSDKAVRLHFGHESEFLPISQIELLENLKGGNDWTDGIASRCLKIPFWLFVKLRGKNFYDASYE